MTNLTNDQETIRDEVLQILEPLERRMAAEEELNALRSERFGELGRKHRSYLLSPRKSIVTDKLLRIRAEIADAIDEVLKILEESGADTSIETLLVILETMGLSRGSTRAVLLGEAYMGRMWQINGENNLHRLSDD